jgi:hypothetical protein
MDDYNSGESPEGTAESASIASGFGGIIDGVVDVATSAGDAALNSAYAVGDTAAGTYYSAAAAGDAFIGDMAGANANSDEANKQIAEAHEDVDNVGKDIGF